MINDSYRAIGLMSGTSLDGLDIAFCSFEFDGEQWSFHLEASKSVSYEDSLRKRLQQGVELSSLELLGLDREYGVWLGQQVDAFVRENQVQADFVASHGHTVFHQPWKGITYQVGSGQWLANACGLEVICDFRTKDVSLGGQGAPLVPIGDKYLFPGYDFCLNLGGIANVSFTEKGDRLAYDIGIANMLLNYLAGQLGKTYDRDGQHAAAGICEKQLFDELNGLSYYAAPYPKSTGYEWFSEEILPLIKKSPSSVADKLNTSVHHIAYQVARAIQKSRKDGKVLVTGGGARNIFLIETLRHYLQDAFEVIVPEGSIVDFKEAIVFAFMGVLKKRHEVNCLRSVTGALRDSSSGVIFTPY
ncbi:MAG: anhydro-N-acetylmuramic acid kinase [Cytophagales bacterium]|nr:anhydro-N-acetylmuramic acid kinase [Cytophagales bacterium]